MKKIYLFFDKKQLSKNQINEICSFLGIKKPLKNKKSIYFKINPCELFFFINKYENKYLISEILYFN